MTHYTFEDKPVTCRVPHTCAWCGEVIAARRRAQYARCMVDGAFYSEWMHPECNDALHQLCAEAGSPLEFTPGDFLRGSTEMR